MEVVRRELENLFCAQGDDWVDPRSANRGNPTGDDGRAAEEQADGKKDQRIRRADAEEHAAHDPRKGESGAEADNQSDCEQTNPLPKNERNNLVPPSA